MGNCILSKHELKEDDVSIIKSCTNMSDQDVDRWRDEFSEKYPKGYMTKKQFAQELKLLRNDQPIDKYLIDRIFSAFDRDDSDTINFGEFMAGFVSVFGEDLNKKLEYCFLVYDRDGDRLLSRKEVKKILRILLIGRVHSHDEVEQYLNTIFTNVDMDKDDHLSLTEFLEGCRNDESIMTIMNPFNP